MLNFCVKKITLSLLPIIFLSGCSLAPKYHRPDAPVSETWPTGEAYSANNPSEEYEAISWSDFVKDEQLHSVIELTLENSRDLRQALANIEAARAAYRIQDANKYPTFGAGVNGTRGRNLVPNLSKDDHNVTAIGSNYTANIALSSFELDFFGKIRNMSEVALNNYLSTEEATRSLHINIIAEVANLWLTYAADQSQLNVARKTEESAKESVDIMRKRFNAGIGSQLELNQAETIYYQARADVANYKTIVAQDRNALALLVGHKIDDELLPNELPASVDRVFAKVPEGLSSEILLKRPDVLAAEYSLLSANANIGVARAAFFPSISLTGSKGIASVDLSNLFDGGAASVWSIMPSISLPIFTGGANKANLKYAEAQWDLYLAKYEQAIQTAFKEVADALARKGTIGDQVTAQLSLLAVAKQNIDLTEKRYRAGMDGYLNVLDAQRTLYSAERAMVLARLTELTNRVALYRVFGGE